jgi:hypothetical protein
MHLHQSSEIEIELLGPRPLAVVQRADACSGPHTTRGCAPKLVVSGAVTQCEAKTE